MKKLFITFALLLFAIASLFLSAEKQTFLLAFEDYPPYEYVDNGQVKGFHVEILNAVAAIMNISFTYQAFPWERCLEMVKNGTADAISSLSKNADRLAWYIYPATELSVEQNILFTAKGNTIVFTGNLNELKQYVIETTQGYSYSDEFDNATFLKKEEAPNNDSLVKMVAGKRVPLGIGNKLVISFVAKKLGLFESITILPVPVTKGNLYCGFSKIKKLDQLAEKFSLALAQFKKTAEYRALVAKYNAE